MNCFVLRKCYSLRIRHSSVLAFVLNLISKIYAKHYKLQVLTNTLPQLNIKQRHIMLQAPVGKLQYLFRSNKKINTSDCQLCFMSLS